MKILKLKKEKRLPTETNIIYNYYSITHETREETKTENIDSREKDKNNEKIKYKNYIITIYRKDIKRNKDSKKSEFGWYKYETKKRKNTHFNMEYRRGEKTGAYSYTYFGPREWNHKYEY